jgi:hypothetical protein
MLHAIIRYGTLVFIALQLTSELPIVHRWIGQPANDTLIPTRKETTGTTSQYPQW